MLLLKQERKKLFRFENMWTRHVECTDIVKEGWDMHSKSDLKDLVTEIENCGK